MIQYLGIAGAVEVTVTDISEALCDVAASYSALDAPESTLTTIESVVLINPQKVRLYGALITRRFTPKSVRIGAFLITTIKKAVLWAIRGYENYLWDQQELINIRLMEEIVELRERLRSTERQNERS